MMTIQFANAPPSKLHWNTPSKLLFSVIVAVFPSTLTEPFIDTVTIRGYIIYYMVVQYQFILLGRVVGAGVGAAIEILIAGWRAKASHDPAGVNCTFILCVPTDRFGNTSPEEPIVLILYR